jgi:universal stress protein A
MDYDYAAPPTISSPPIGFSCAEIARCRQGALLPHKKRTAFRNSGAAHLWQADKIGTMKAQLLTNKTTKSPGRTNESDGSRSLAIKKILVPTDFSDPSRKAFKYATRIGGEFGSEIVLLHVMEQPPPIAAMRTAYDARQSYENELASAKKNLRAVSAPAQSNRFPSVSSAIRTGYAPTEITEAAKDLDVDLIVMATHGHTGWKHFAIGSTAERVVRAAPCPVLVVREKEHDFI